MEYALEPWEIGVIQAHLKQEPSEEEKIAAVQYARMAFKESEGAAIDAGRVNQAIAALRIYRLEEEYCEGGWHPLLLTRLISAYSASITRHAGEKLNSKSKSKNPLANLAREAFAVAGKLEHYMNNQDSIAAWRFCLASARLVRIAHEMFRLAFDEHAVIGMRVEGGGRKGHRAAHGTREGREERYRAWKQEVNDLTDKGMKITNARHQVAKKYRVSCRTILRHTK
ncbi:MAG: hypothetical protein M5U26_29175 [Planctomycetota bacterium]|nr:hypothetical protein [Planctomycetota bacterium]